MEMQNTKATKAPNGVGLDYLSREWWDLPWKGV